MNTNGRTPALAHPQLEALDLVKDLSPQLAGAVRDFYAQQLLQLEPTGPKADRFKIHSAAEALQPQPEIEWMVKNFIEAGNVYAVIGDAGSGKTYMMLDMGAAIANGEQQWGEFQVMKNCPVLLIDEESGERRINRRMKYIMRAHEAGENLPFYYISLARFDIRNPEDTQALQAKILETGAGLVIIDAFMDVIPGADENSTKDVLPGLLALGLISKSTNCAIVIIHHTNKAGGYRGSSAIKGNVDGMYIIERAADSPVVEVRSEKDRDIKSARFSMLANFATNPTTGELESVCFSAAEAGEKAPIFSKAEKYVLTFLQNQAKKQAETTTITSAADICSEGSARQAVYSLANKGYITRVDKAGPGSKATYGLTVKGLEVNP